MFCSQVRSAERLRAQCFRVFGRMADEKRREALGGDTDPVIVIQSEGPVEPAPPSYEAQPQPAGSALALPSPNSSLSSNSINISELCKSPEQAATSQVGRASASPLPSVTRDTSQLLAYTKPKSNELMAWLSCLICCWPIGLFAVVHANLSDKANCKRDAEKAEYHGIAAKHFAVGAIFAGTLVYLMVAFYIGYLYIAT